MDHLGSVSALLQRELRALRREIELYPSDEALWATPPGISNSGGTLAVHVLGNLRHYVGARLGGTGYVRDRASEFTVRDVPRSRILAELDRATEDVRESLSRLDRARLDDTFPDAVGGFHVETGDFLLQVAVHLAYHVGQLDYHRRIVTGDGRTATTMAMGELRSARKAEG
jgi:hypothetical protein